MKKLFVLGDSISIHYGTYLEKYIQGIFEYNRKGYNQNAGDLNHVSAVNGGDSNNVLSFLSENESLVCDILLLNCGLHDIKTVSGYKQVTEEKYKENLEKIIASTIERGKIPVWVTTTPIDDAIHNMISIGYGYCRYSKDVKKYNEIALSIMKKNNVKIIDLYNFTNKLGDGVYCDHAHFIPDVRKLQAAYIAGAIEALRM